MRSSAWRISVIWKSGYGEILFPEATLPRSLRYSGRHRANSVLPADSAVTPGNAESSSKTLILCNFAQFLWGTSRTIPHCGIKESPWTAII